MKVSYERRDLATAETCGFLNICESSTAEGSLGSVQWPIFDAVKDFFIAQILGQKTGEPREQQVY